MSVKTENDQEDLVVDCASSRVESPPGEEFLTQAFEDTGRVDTRPADSATDTSVTDSNDATDASDASDTSVTDTGPLPCLAPPLDSGS